jgi:hypothetical protein
MSETKRSIERAGLQAPTPDFSLDDLRDRRDRQRRRRRLAGGIVGVGVTMALVAAAVMSLGSFGDPGRALARDGGVGLPPPTRGLAAVSADKYSYQHLVVRGSCPGHSDGQTTVGIVDGLAVCPDEELDLESWWTSDGSGLIQVNTKQNYGFAGGTFGPGEFPAEGDVSGYPLDPVALRAFLLERSGSTGASPRPDVTPAPGVPLDEGLLWNAIQDYLGDTQYLNSTPALRAAMLEVLATLPMVSVDASATDPAGRDAIALRFFAYDQDVVVFVDPATHDFSAMTKVSPDTGSREAVVVEAAGATASISDPPSGTDLSVRPPR